MRPVRLWGRILAVMAGVACSGCALMPTSGPASDAVRSGSADVDSLPYALVKMTPKVVATLARNAPRLSTGMADRRVPQEIRFGVGDIVGVTIFEASSGGLFIPAEAGVRPGNFITLPPQAVDVHGNVSIPYGGAIRARGRTQVELQQAIVDSLKNRAIEPQVVVSVVDQRTSLVTVITDGRAARVPALLSPERLLDTIARVGGPGGAG